MWDILQKFWWWFFVTHSSANGHSLFNWIRLKCICNRCWLTSQCQSSCMVICNSNRGKVLSVKAWCVEFLFSYGWKHDKCTFLLFVCSLRKRSVFHKHYIFIPEGNARDDLQNISLLLFSYMAYCPRVFYCICLMILHMWCTIDIIWQSSALLEQGCTWIWHWIRSYVGWLLIVIWTWLLPKCNTITQAWQSFTSFSEASELRFCNVFIEDPSAPYCGKLCGWGLDIHFPCKWWLILFARYMCLPTVV